jgi:hypothetical protein
MLRKFMQALPGKRKQQKPPLRPSARTASNARPQVFSYYSSRRIQEQQKPSKSPFQRQKIQNDTADSTPRAAGLNVSARQAPAIAAIVVIGICVLYTTTLNATPKVRVRMLNGDQTIVYRPMEEYQRTATEALGASIANKSKLTLQRDSIADAIQDGLPEVRTVRLATPLLSRNLVISLQTDDAGVGLRTPTGAYLLDSSGTVISELGNAPAADGLPIINDDTGAEAEVGRPALTALDVSFISQLHHQLTAQKLPKATMTLPAGIANELHVRFEGQPYYVKYALSGDVRLQTGTYLATKADLDGKGKPPSEYIDVRVEGRAYVK